MPWDRASFRVTTEGLLAGPVFSPVVKISSDFKYLQEVTVDTPTSAGTTNTISVQRQVSVDGENFVNEGSAMTSNTIAEVKRNVFVRWAVTNTTGTPTSFVSADINVAVFSSNSLSVAEKAEGSDYVFGNKEILGKMESHKNNLICVGDSISTSTSSSFDSFPQGFVRNARPTKWRGWFLATGTSGSIHGCFDLVGLSSRYFERGILPGETVDNWAGSDLGGDSNIPKAFPTFNGYWPAMFSIASSAIEPPDEDDNNPTVFNNLWQHAWLTGYIAAADNASGISGTKFATKRPFKKKDGNPSFTSATNFKYKAAIITGETGDDTNSAITDFAIDKFNVQEDNSIKDPLLFALTKIERNGTDGTQGSLLPTSDDARYVPWGTRFNQTSDKVGMHIWESPDAFTLASTTFQSGTGSGQVGRVNLILKGPSNTSEAPFPATDRWVEKLGVGLTGAILYDDDVDDSEGMTVSHIGDGSWKIANHAYEFGDSNVPRLSIDNPSGAPGYYGSYKDEGLQGYARFMDANRVMFALGTNDDSTIVGNVDQKFEDYKAMVARFRRLLPGIEMIILVPYFSGTGSGANNIRAARAELFEKLKDEFGSDEDCVILDMQAWIETWITGSGWDDLSSNNPIQDGNFDTDGVHPTAAFMDALTTWIWSRVVQYAKDV